MRRDLTGKRIWVAGHRGMVGAALLRRLQAEPCEVVTVGREGLDLADPAAVLAWMADARPDVVILAAARVGGILENDRYPVDFLMENLRIQTSVFTAAHAVGVDRLLFLGSSCIYPKLAAQPIREDALLTGPLEPTNQWYALAKIAGIKMTQAYRRQFGRDYISAMPTNLYGPGDNFDLASGHVLPALLRKAHAAKSVGAGQMTIWGSGTPRREFLHVDDLADALVFLLGNYSQEAPVNLGSGTDVTIRELAGMVCDAVGFKGDIVLDPDKPDGTPRKLLDSNRLRAMGWTPKVDLPAGIFATYQWFLEHEG